MFSTSVEFGNTVVPASGHAIRERNRRMKAALSNQAHVAKDTNSSPISGNWTSKRYEINDLNPAGIRVPKDFKMRWVNIFFED